LRFEQYPFDVVIPAVVHQGSHALQFFCPRYAGPIYHNTIRRYTDRRVGSGLALPNSTAARLPI
jgi:hypothetical protein